MPQRRKGPTVQILAKRHKKLIQIKIDVRIPINNCDYLSADNCHFTGLQEFRKKVTGFSGARKTV